MKIVNFRKFFKSIMIILGIIFVLSLIIIKSTFSYKDIIYKTIYVSQGDTLWNIAKISQKYNIYYKEKDIRYIIDDIMKVNNLKTSNLKVNQELKIPTL